LSSQADVAIGFATHQRPARDLSKYNSQRRARKIALASRRVARLAQCENPLAVRLRNFLVRSFPARLSERQLDAILNIHLEPQKGWRSGAAGGGGARLCAIVSGLAAESARALAVNPKVCRAPGSESEMRATG